MFFAELNRVCNVKNLIIFNAEAIFMVVIAHVIYIIQVVSGKKQQVANCCLFSSWLAKLPFGLAVLSFAVARVLSLPNLYFFVQSQIFSEQELALNTIVT